MRMSPSCKETTRLISQSMDGKLTVLQRVGVRLHLMLCDFCRRFEKQVRWMEAKAKAASVHEHAKMDTDFAQRLRQMLSTADPDHSDPNGS